ncbi:MAG: hypothetical protein AAGD28_00315 [Bacteroidota bacterium]
MGRKNLLILFIVLFIQGCLQAQTGIKSQGAYIKVSQGAKLFCPGNIELKDQGSQLSKLELNGELFLSGDFINSSFTKVLDPISHTGGCIHFNGLEGIQKVRGDHGFAIHRAIVSNPFGLKLEKDLGIYQDLFLEDGKLFTGANMLVIFNTDVSAIRNFNEDRYIVGKLRRYLGVGNTPFPIGSEDNLQFLNLQFDREPGLLFVDASFSSTLQPLHTAIELDGGSVRELLDNGSWELYSPQNPSQPFRLSLTSRGHSNGGEQEGVHTFLLDKGFGWEAAGNLNRDESTGFGENEITSTRDQIQSWGSFAIAKSDYVLSNPGLADLQNLEVYNNGSPERKIGLKFFAGDSGAYTLEIRDLKGAILYSSTAFAFPGNNYKELDLSKFSTSIYTLILRKEGSLLSQKIW